MECTSPEARQWCLDDVMGHLPAVGSNDNNTWHGRAGCGALVCLEGTYTEAHVAVIEHRDAVRQQQLLHH